MAQLRLVRPQPHVMLKGMRTLFARRLQRQLIELATEALYSEQFDIGAIVTRLSRNQPGVPLLRAYIAVQTAAQLTEPLTNADVERALATVRLSEARSDTAVFGDILDVHRELAEHYWSKAHLAILRGKLAHKNDQYSYEGAIYGIQYSNKGPASKEQRAKYEPMLKEMADLSRQIEEAELKAWKEQDQQEYHRYKEELEARALSAEIDANEDESIALQGAEVLLMLNAKLDSLLHDGNRMA